MLLRLFIASLWSPSGKGLTSWLLLVMNIKFLLLSHEYPGSGVVLDCIACHLSYFYKHLQFQTFQAQIHVCI